MQGSHPGGPGYGLDRYGCWTRPSRQSMVTPFHAGSLCMVQCGDMLHIRTSHKMCIRNPSLDGPNHQANLTLGADFHHGGDGPARCQPFRL